MDFQHGAGIQHSAALPHKKKSVIVPVLTPFPRFGASTTVGMPVW